MKFFGGRTSQARPLDVVVYGKDDCHLCEVAKEVIRATAHLGAIEIDLKAIDIESYDELRRLYSQQIPVVFIEGKKAFKSVVDRRRLAEKFARELRRIGEPEGAPR